MRIASVEASNLVFSMRPRNLSLKPTRFIKPVRASVLAACWASASLSTSWRACSLPHRMRSAARRASSSNDMARPTATWRTNCQPGCALCQASVPTLLPSSPASLRLEYPAGVLPVIHCKLLKANAAPAGCSDQGPSKLQKIAHRVTNSFQSAATPYLAPRPTSITFAVSKMIARSSMMERCLM